MDRPTLAAHAASAAGPGYGASVSPRMMPGLCGCTPIPPHRTRGRGGKAEGRLVRGSLYAPCLAASAQGRGEVGGAGLRTIRSPMGLAAIPPLRSWDEEAGSPAKVGEGRTLCPYSCWNARGRLPGGRAKRMARMKVHRYLPCHARLGKACAWEAQFRRPHVGGTHSSRSIPCRKDPARAHPPLGEKKKKRENARRQREVIPGMEGPLGSSGENMEFIDIFLLLTFAKEGADITVPSKEVEKQKWKRKVKPKESIDNWLEAFAMLSTVIMEKFPEQGPALCKYSRVIYEEYTRNGGTGRLNYNREFRQKMEQAPEMA
ncbi:hypothetical protein NDU88_001504 [Pleurodeles waltl]|uniref:Uncharacterized protein n=1 Tax=Pleurodeles waltl TaxID=8319 RepID=A0AAV7U845_PLEWA|nr:hypothetical protein NDU88_001504 [Pleurodeles waltl]